MGLGLGLGLGLALWLGSGLGLASGFAWQKSCRAETGLRPSSSHVAVAQAAGRAGGPALTPLPAVIPAGPRGAAAAGKGGLGAAATGKSGITHLVRVKVRARVRVGLRLGLGLGLGLGLARTLTPGWGKVGVRVRVS